MGANVAKLPELLRKVAEQASDRQRHFSRGPQAGRRRASAAA
jgi:hypothetical protein